MSRLWRRGVMLLVAFWGAVVPSLAADSQTYLLQSKRAKDATDHIEVLLEVEGHLKVADASSPEGDKTTPLKMNATATLSYDEKTLAVPDASQQALRAVRYYEKAEASIRIGGGEVRPSLRDQRRLIGVETTGPKTTLFSPQGTLTREELDLVDPPGNSLVLDRLLPEKPVAVGGGWKIPDDVLAAICGLEEARSSDVRGTLVAVGDGTARVEITGRLTGAVVGLSTKIEVKGKCRFDVKAGRITWLALLIKEDRTPGPIGPGLDVVARLQLKVVPGAKSARLASEALKGVGLEATGELRRLSYAAPDGAWQVSHDRRWVVISEQESTAVLRMADEGDYVAQCNIASAPKLDGKSAPKLTDFQEDIRAALGKNFQQFLRASESTGKAGEHVYRVEVSGVVSDLPIQWIYYLLGDENGRRVMAAFTIEGEMIERFHEADADLIRTLRLGDPKVAADPKPAAPQK